MLTSYQKLLIKTKKMQDPFTIASPDELKSKDKAKLKL